MSEKKCERCGCEIEDRDGYNYCNDCMDKRLKGQGEKEK